MGFADRFNLKKQWEEIKGEAEEGVEETHVKLEEEERDASSKIFDRHAVNLAKLVAPESASWEENHYKIGDEYTRTLFIHNYPPQVEDNWLREILRFPHAVDVAIYVQPLNKNAFLKEMRRRASRDEASLDKAAEEGVHINQRRASRFRDTMQFIEALQTDQTRPFQVMVALTIRARSLKELDKITADLEGQMSTVKTRSARWRHKQGFESTLPLMQNSLADSQAVRPMHTQGLMSMFPFSSAELSHESGVLIGLSRQTGSPIILNRFLQPIVKSPNTCIFGATGSGKSFLAKIEMQRFSCLGKTVIVLDPSGEYRDMTKALGGENITVSMDSAETINPLDFSNAVSPGHNALRDKIAFMIDMLSVMLRSEQGTGLIIDAVTRQIFDNALQEAYRRYHYFVDSVESQQGATSDHMPTLSEVYFFLERIARTRKEPVIQQRMLPLLAAMGQFVGDGTLAPLFDHKTTVQMSSDFINFDYSSLPEQYLPLAMHLVLEFIRSSFFTARQRESGENVLLYVDEAQILMKNDETAKFLEDSIRTSRKYGIGITVMTQNVGVFAAQNEDGSQNKRGAGILANCTIKILLRQEPSERDAVRNTFRMTTSEVSNLLGAQTGEGLIYVGNETVWFSAANMASQEEYAMMTTTTSERAALRQAAERAQLESNPQLVDESHRLQAQTAPEPDDDDELDLSGSPFDFS